ncbi:MAG: LPS export ABC transporter periplasmic protein LptC [Xanthobacteraceae bacterium]|nr:LPS export ABC transporter periplasmic protein LptC [Xanthobacteraceae bacterium]MBX3549590.1 LPS export ABC transporter periplasmic protein LptC [Xanthobacteraceae bacterium]MCW5677604.1 LPS export ABC transporter periplasmic protein LptC [Xanthobacteraceae bacterium]
MSDHAYSRRPEHARAAGRNPRRQAPDPRMQGYGAAIRHSSRVRFLRRVLPAIVLSILLLAGVIAWLDPFRIVRDFPLDVLKLSIKDNKLVMDAPKLSGFTKDGRGYSITADAAAQDLTKMNVIELQGIKANFTLTNNGRTELIATKGVYDAKADFVQLTEGVVIRSTAGYEGKLQDAMIEVKRGHVVTTNPVDITFNNGSLRADRMEIFDNGARAVFEGGITMFMKLPPAKDEAQE